MTKVKKGHTINIHYTGKLKDGTTFDSSLTRGEPLQFTVGAGHVIQGFDDGVIDMEVGDAKTLNIPVDKAYGPIQNQLIFPIPKENLPENMNPAVGQQLQLTNKDGLKTMALVTQIENDHILVDANHALAGKELIFEIQLIDIKK